MIYIDMNGRCGNQFFQYAFARKLSMLNGNMPITVDFFHVERWKEKTGFNDFCDQLCDFNTLPYTSVMGNGDSLKDFGTKKQIKIRNQYAKIRSVSARLKLSAPSNMWQAHLQKNGVYRDDEYKIVPRKCNSKDIFVRGYFEDPAYFDDMHRELMEEFTPVQPPKAKNAELYDIINNRNSVCVSFRVWTGVSAKTRNVCTLQYYNDAIALMKELHPDATFIVFSNDVEWVKNNYKFPGDTYYEDGTDEIWEKLRLMYSCKHFIMSTSTFCWWAQYLCRNEQKTVIAPDRWNNEKNGSRLLMSDWKAIHVE